MSIFWDRGRIPSLGTLSGILPARGAGSPPTGRAGYLPGVTGPPPPPTIEPACALCGGEAFDTLDLRVRDHVWRRPGAFALQRCRSCALVATRPRPTDAGMAFYYDDAYSGGAGAMDMGGFYRGPFGRLLNRYRRVTLEKARPLTPDDHVLDVGCSQGHLLQVLRQDRGVAAAGLDLDEGSIAAAVDPDAVDYRVGRVVDAPWPPSSFTVVTFYECLEHETDPVAALEAAHRLLRPGGLCVVEVPDFDSPWRRVFGGTWLPLLVPQHLSHFTGATLGATLQAAGFELVHRQAMVFPGEFTVSLAIWLVERLGLEPMDEDDKPVGRRLVELALGLGLMLLFGLIDLPAQVAFRLAGHTGHQTAVGRKPAPPLPPPATGSLP